MLPAPPHKFVGILQATLDAEGLNTTARYGEQGGEVTLYARAGQGIVCVTCNSIDTGRVELILRTNERTIAGTTAVRTPDELRIGLRHFVNELLYGEPRG